MPTLTEHAINRIRSRLSGLTSPQEVTERVNRFHVTEHRYFIEVKRIPYIEITDKTIKPDGIARGDSIVAICESGKIHSVILRKSWSQSPEFKKIYRKPNQ